MLRLVEGAQLCRTDVLWVYQWQFYWKNLAHLHISRRDFHMSASASASASAGVGAGAGVGLGAGLGANSPTQGKLVPPPSSMDLYQQVLDWGGHFYFDPYHSDSFQYAKLLLGCQQFGPAIAHLKRAGKVVCAVHLGMVCTYYGLIAAEEELLDEMQVSLSLSLRLKGLFLYTGGVLFHVECCIRQLYCSSIILYSITSIAHDQYTDIYPLLNV